MVVVVGENYTNRVVGVGCWSRWVGRVGSSVPWPVRSVPGAEEDEICRPGNRLVRCCKTGMRGCVGWKCEDRVTVKCITFRKGTNGKDGTDGVWRRGSGRVGVGGCCFCETGYSRNKLSFLTRSKPRIRAPSLVHGCECGWRMRWMAGKK